MAEANYVLFFIYVQTPRQTHPRFVDPWQEPTNRIPQYENMIWKEAEQVYRHTHGTNLSPIQLISKKFLHIYIL